MTRLIPHLSRAWPSLCHTMLASSVGTSMLRSTLFPSFTSTSLSFLVNSISSPVNKHIYLNCKLASYKVVYGAAMTQAFFSLYCLLKNTLPPKVFFRFFKVQILFFFQKIFGF